jgi:thiamine-phosphate pyrophosphorylase
MQKLKGLYVIADANCIGKNDIIAKTKEVLSSGVNIIQYRDKLHSFSDRKNIGHQLRKLTASYQSLFIINDDVDLAKEVAADGVHLGKDDASIMDAREKLDESKIIGASCYNNFEIAKLVIESSADYIAFGSFFPSQTKPNAPRANIELIKQVKKSYSVPICAIGGITPENALQLVSAGADMIAVISSIFNASSPKQAVQEYLSVL